MIKKAESTWYRCYFYDHWQVYFRGSNQSEDISNRLQVDEMTVEV